MTTENIKWISINKERFPTDEEIDNGVVVLWKDGRMGCVHFRLNADFWSYVEDRPDFFFPLPGSPVPWDCSLDGYEL